MLTFVQFAFVALCSVSSVFTMDWFPIGSRSIAEKEKEKEKKEKEKRSVPSSQSSPSPSSSSTLFSIPYPRLNKMTVPLQAYISMSVLFGIVSVMNNIAFSFNVSHHRHHLGIIEVVLTILTS